MKIPGVSLLILFLCGCASDSDYVGRHQWKHGEGFSIGDWVSFNNTTHYYRIKNDTLFVADTARAVVIEVDRQLGGDVELMIRSLSTRDSGIYHEK